MEESSVSPLIHLSAHTTFCPACVHWFWQYSTHNRDDLGHVEISTDGGANWTLVAAHGVTVEGFVILDVSAQLGGQANAQISFRCVDGGIWAGTGLSTPLRSTEVSATGSKSIASFV